MGGIPPVVLDERLGAVARLFPVCGYGADIGADHGKLSAYLLQRNICGRMLVTDISAASLQKAQALMRRLGLSERVRWQVADGFDEMDEKLDCVAVCGMGGRTVCRMLERRFELPGHPALILLAHTELPRLRAVLAAHHHRIEREVLVRSGGRYYIAIRAVWGEESLSPRDIALGRHLTSESAACLADYYRWQTALEGKKKHPDAEKLMWLKEALETCETRR